MSMIQKQIEDLKRLQLALLDGQQPSSFYRSQAAVIRQAIDTIESLGAKLRAQNFGRELDIGEREEEIDLRELRFTDLLCDCAPEPVVRFVPGGYWEYRPFNPNEIPDDLLDQEVIHRVPISDVPQYEE